MMTDFFDFLERAAVIWLVIQRFIDMRGIRKCFIHVTKALEYLTGITHEQN